MKPMLPIPAALLSVAAGLAGAQPLEKPPAAHAQPRIEVRSADPAAPTLTEPDASEQLPPKREVKPETRIEQRRHGRRIAEIIVTPAGRSYSYTIENREGRQPLLPQETTGGLSTPRFLKFEF